MTGVQTCALPICSGCSGGHGGGNGCVHGLGISAAAAGKDRCAQGKYKKEHGVFFHCKTSKIALLKTYYFPNLAT